MSPSTAAYKVFGDSIGVKFNQGSLGDVTFDGNTSSLPHGDTTRLERAYFNYSNDIGAVPVNFSLGRRPSTEGPPMGYRNYGWRVDHLWPPSSTDSLMVHP